MKKVDDKIKPIFEENQKLKSEVEKLNNKILSLEVNSKRNNILIHGLPELKEEKPEDLITLVISTLKEIEVELKIGEIDWEKRATKMAKLDQSYSPPQPYRKKSGF